MSSGSMTPALSSGRIAVDAGGGVAAGAGDQPRGADLVAVELGQAVDRLGLQVERVVRVAVPVLVDRRVAQAEVGGEIDDLQVARQPGDHLLGGGVRQGAEGEVDRRRSRRRRWWSSVGRSRWRRCGKTSPMRLPGLAVGGQRGDAQAADAWRSAARARRRCSRWRRGWRRRRPLHARHCPGARLRQSAGDQSRVATGSGRRRAAGECAIDAQLDARAAAARTAAAAGEDGGAGADRRRDRRR